MVPADKKYHEGSEQVCVPVVCGLVCLGKSGLWELGVIGLFFFPHSTCSTIQI